MFKNMKKENIPFVVIGAALALVIAVICILVNIRNRQMEEGLEGYTDISDYEEAMEIVSDEEVMADYGSTDKEKEYIAGMITEAKESIDEYLEGETKDVEALGEELDSVKEALSEKLKNDKETDKAQQDSINQIIKQIEVIQKTMNDKPATGTNGTTVNNNKELENEIRQLQSSLQKNNTSIFTSVDSKANKADLDKLSSSVDSKANKSDLDRMSSSIDSKANKSDVERLGNTIDSKADKSDITNLSGEIDKRAIIYYSVKDGVPTLTVTNMKAGE